jgi:hypothetical protein
MRYEAAGTRATGEFEGKRQTHGSGSSKKERDAKHSENNPTRSTESETALWFYATVDARFSVAMDDQRMRADKCTLQNRWTAPSRSTHYTAYRGGTCIRWRRTA